MARPMLMSLSEITPSPTQRFIPFSPLYRQRLPVSQLGDADASLAPGAAAGLAFINSIGTAGGFAGPYLMGFLRDFTGSFTAGLIAERFTRTLKEPAWARPFEELRAALVEFATRYCGMIAPP
jgi:hypothetical protein